MLDEPDQARTEGEDAERLRRLAGGLTTASQSGRARWRNDRLLLMMAGALAPLGVLLVLFGWLGASRTPNVYEQIPYLISGGELGQTLATLGAFLYFAHWLAALTKEHRTQGAAIVAAIAHLEQAMLHATSGSGTDGRPAGAQGAAPTLVVTARGSLAHRPDCTVVVGKLGLRAVTATDGLAPCKLCLPHGGPAS